MDRFLEEKTHLIYDASIATSHLRRGTSDEAEAPRHLTHPPFVAPSTFGARAISRSQPAPSAFEAGGFRWEEREK